MIPSPENLLSEPNQLCITLEFLLVFWPLSFHYGVLGRLIAAGRWTS